MSRKLVNLAAIGIVFLAAGTQGAANHLYMPVDLGTLGGDQSVALAVNDHGMVVGWAETALTEAHAFLWIDGRIQDLHALGGKWSEGRAINNEGVVVGTSETADGEQHGFVWHDGVMHNLTELLRVEVQPKNAIGDSDSCYGQIERFVEANDINDHGWIVGCAYMEGDMQLHGILAVPYFAGPPPKLDPAYFYVDLGRILPGDDCLALGVNDAAMAVGISGDAAFRWVGEKMERLEPAPAMSFAGDVNDTGTVVGWTQPFDPGCRRTACMWVDGVRHDLPVFPDGVSDAVAINETDLVVGWAAVAPGAPRVAMLWEACAAYELNHITIVLPWLTITQATDINGMDEIVGFATSIEGHKRAFLLYDSSDP